MESIKKLLRLLFLFPVMAYGQTVHIDDDRIVYKGTVKVGQISKDNLYESVKQAIYDNVSRSKKNTLLDDKTNGRIAVKGKMKLTTPYHLVRTVGFLLEVIVDDGGYKYRIDSVYMVQVERGGKTIKARSGDVYKGIEATGPESVEAEKIVNEIDLKFQKMLVLIKSDIRKEEVAQSK